MIVDVVADDTIGLDLFTQILDKRYVKIIACTSLASPTLITNLLDNGVIGYFSKRGSSDELLKAADAIVIGKRYVPDEYTF